MYNLISRYLYLLLILTSWFIALFFLKWVIEFFENKRKLVILVPKIIQNKEKLIEITDELVVLTKSLNSSPFAPLIIKHSHFSKKSIIL